MPDTGSQMTAGGYKSLKVYRMAHDLAVQVHRMSLGLPSHEKYEEGSQVRRSSKRVSASIVEGYALRKYKALYLSYLYRGLASADETQEHLEFLAETGNKDGDCRTLLRHYQELSRMLFRFIQGVEREHGTLQIREGEEAELEMELTPDEEAALELKRRNPGSGIRNRESGGSSNGK